MSTADVEMILAADEAPESGLEDERASNPPGSAGTSSAEDDPEENDEHEHDNAEDNDNEEEDDDDDEEDGEDDSASEPEPENAAAEAPPAEPAPALDADADASTSAAPNKLSVRKKRKPRSPSPVAPPPPPPVVSAPCVRLHVYYARTDCGGDAVIARDDARKPLGMSMLCKIAIAVLHVVCVRAYGLHGISYLVHPCPAAVLMRGAPYSRPHHGSPSPRLCLPR
jgi:hypothetical protein